MSTMVAGHWLSVKRTDERAFAIYRNHYSAKKNAAYRQRGNFNVAGPAQTMVLLADDCRSLFVWIRNTVERLDHQVGVNCAVFRNASPRRTRVLSSELIREADDLAWGKWPGARLFTYVDPAEIRSARAGREAGSCFLAAGWRPCGQSADGKLLFEMLPEWATGAAPLAA